MEVIQLVREVELWGTWLVKLGVSQSLVQSDATNIVVLSRSWRTSRWPNHRLCIQDVRASQPIDWPCNTSGPCCCGRLAWERWSLPLGRYREASGGEAAAVVAEAFSLCSSSVTGVPVILQQFQLFFDVQVPQIQFSDSSGLQLHNRDVYPQCTLRSRPLKFSLCIDKCVDVLLIMQRQVPQWWCLRFSSSTSETCCATETATQWKKFHRCSS